MPKHAIPVILTPADWAAHQRRRAKWKDKGEIAVLTAELRKLKTVFDKISWEGLDPDQAIAKRASPDGMSVAALNLVAPAAIQNLSELKPTRKQLKAISAQAEAMKVLWKGNKIIPAAARRHVDEMRVAANLLLAELSEAGIRADWAAAIDKAQENEDRLAAIGLAAIRPYFASLRQYAAEVRANPTVDEFDGGTSAGFFQNIRGLNAAIQRSRRPDLIAFKDQRWKKLAQPAFKPKVDSEVLGKVQQVLDVLDDLEDLVG